MVIGEARLTLLSVPPFPERIVGCHLGREANGMQAFFAGAACLYSARHGAGQPNAR